MSQDPAIDLAIRVLDLLDRGSFVATYKYAVLLGLLDICMEQSEQGHAEPHTVTTRELAMKVLQLYWPHTMEYPTKGVVLKQGGPAILGAIRRFRHEHAPTPSAGRWVSERANKEKYKELLDEVEWTLIEMPLPRVQRVGKAQSSPFLYTMDWSDTGPNRVRKGAVRRYQAGHTNDFDNRIWLLPGVCSALVRLNGLLRPILMREWAAMVAKLNQLEEARLEQFLFGVKREQLIPVRSGLRELQRGLCFYCEELLTTASDIDHFIAWSRVRENAIENLVLTHKSCNRQKSDHLAGVRHLDRWHRRMERTSGRSNDLSVIAERIGWESRPSAVMGIARSVYLCLPDKAKLWSGGSQFEDADHEKLRGVLHGQFVGTDPA